MQLVIAIVDTTRDTLRIAISTPFEIGESEETLSYPVDPEKDDDRLGRLIQRLRHKILTGCHIELDGTLRLTFSDGLLIVVPPDPKYEAWDIDHTHFKIVGAAKGGLAVWDRDR